MERNWLNINGLAWPDPGSEDDGVPFEEKMAEFSATLYEQFTEAGRLKATIKRNLELLGYGE